MNLDPRVPPGPLADKWDQHRFHMKLVNPANKRKYRIFVVGTGLAGGSAAASKLAELPATTWTVPSASTTSPRRTPTPSPPRAASTPPRTIRTTAIVFIAFSTTRLIKGGDFRSREANVYRLAQVSVNIIDQCVAQVVPFAARVRRASSRQPLVRRRPGVAHLLLPRPDRPAAAARRLPGPLPPDRGRPRHHAPAHRDARPDRHRRPGPRHRHAQPRGRPHRVRSSATPSCWPPAATGRSISFPPTPCTAT